MTHAPAVLLALIAGSLPSPVDVLQEPDGVTLGDPSFEALPGARADFGRLGGSVYQIEIPDRWNGRLVLFMHGYGELAPTADVSAARLPSVPDRPGLRLGRLQLQQHLADPGSGGRRDRGPLGPVRPQVRATDAVYATGQSMGGAATHVAAERYGNRFDGALGLCGAASQTPATAITADFFAAAAYVAGVTQRELDRTSSVHALIRDRILPRLRRPAARRRFLDIMVSLTGGPRAFDREGFRMEEETNWERAELLVSAGIAPTAAPCTGSGRRARSPVAPSTGAWSAFTSTVPCGGRSSRVTRSAGRSDADDHAAHDGRRTGPDRAGPHPAPARRRRRPRPPPGPAGVPRPRALRLHDHRVGGSFEALVRWVEHGVRPAGHDVLNPRLDRLRRRFELIPRPGTPEADAVPGAPLRAVVRARLTLDGRPFDARFLGAVVLRDGLVTPCQLALARGAPGGHGDPGDGGRRGERLRRAGRADRALDLRARADHLQPPDMALACSRARCACTPRSRAAGPTPRWRRGRSSRARCSGATGASYQAGRASTPTSARRAAA